jgi:hypothetical protein
MSIRAAQHRAGDGWDEGRLPVPETFDLKSPADFFKIGVPAGKSSNGRTHDSGSCNQGSNPCFPANPLSPTDPEISATCDEP